MMKAFSLRLFTRSSKYSSKYPAKPRAVPRVFLTFYSGLALVTCASMLLSWFFLEGRVREMARADVSSKLASETTLVAQMTASALIGPLNDDDVAVFSDDLRSVAKTTNTRLSLVTADGTVIADSESSPSPAVSEDDRARVATSGGVDALRGSELLAIRPIARRGKVLGYARSICGVDAIEARMTKLKHWALLVGLLFSACTMVLGLVLAQRIVAPILGLQRAAERISRGEFQYPVESARSDEIGDLARSFNTMQRQVKTMIVDLETRERETREYSLVKDRLFIRLSHELRTPCNAIFNTLGLLTNDVVSADARDTLQVGVRASEMLQLGLRDLDDFAQADVSNVSARTTAFDPAALVDEALRAAGVLSTGDVSLTLRPMGDVRTVVSGDAFRLRFAVRCAALFLLEGRSKADLQVEVEVSKAKAVELQIRFIVKNINPLEGRAGDAERISGIDIHNAQAAYLAMCRHLVEGGGGKVALEEGHSTILTLHTWNEASTLSEVSKKVERVDMDSPKTESPIQAPIRVLLVEDEPVNRLIARRVLEKQGFHVTIAEHGARALEVLREVKVDVVLMDIDMPVMNGLEAVAKIRESEHGTGRHLPVVAMTAHAMDGDSARFISAGMDDCVTKPFNAPDLQRIVTKWSHTAAAA